MRKLISCLLALTVVLSLLAVPAFASGSGAGVVSVEMTSTSARAGGSVTLTFTVKNPSGLPIAGIQFSVKADSAWGEPTAEYPCAGKIFDENLVSFDSGVFRATGVLNGVSVTDASWDALKLTYTVPTSAKEEDTYNVTVSQNLLYDGDLKDQAWGTSGPFTVKIVNVILGDVDENESIDGRDALLIAKYEVGIGELGDNAKAAADVNADGFIDGRDALLIAKYEVGIIESFN